MRNLHFGLVKALVFGIAVSVLLVMASAASAGTVLQPTIPSWSSDGAANLGPAPDRPSRVLISVEARRRTRASGLYHGPTQGNYTLGQQTVKQCVRWQRRDYRGNPFYHNQWTYHNCEWWYRWMKNYLREIGYKTPWKWYCLAATAVISAPARALSAFASWVLGIGVGVGCTKFT